MNSKQPNRLNEAQRLWARETTSQVVVIHPRYVTYKILVNRGQLKLHLRIQDHPAVRPAVHYNTIIVDPGSLYAATHQDVISSCLHPTYSQGYDSKQRQEGRVTLLLSANLILVLSGDVHELCISR